MAAIEILTKEDLQIFREQLLADLKNLITTPAKQAKQWLKSAEVRNMLSISPSTLQTLRTNGTIRFTQVGKIMYYKNDDILKLLEGQK